MRATSSVAAQLRIWVAHFVPPVHAMPETSDRSSDWLSDWGGGSATLSSAIFSSDLLFGCADERSTRLAARQEYTTYRALAVPCVVTPPLVAPSPRGADICSATVPFQPDRTVHAAYHLASPGPRSGRGARDRRVDARTGACLLYTSDAADEE